MRATGPHRPTVEGSNKPHLRVARHASVRRRDPIERPLAIAMAVELAHELAAALMWGSIVALHGRYPHALAFLKEGWWEDAAHLVSQIPPPQDAPRPSKHLPAFLSGDRI